MDVTSIDRLTALLAERAWLLRLTRGLVHDAHAAEDLAQDEGLQQRHPDRLRLIEGVLEQRADFVSGALELVLPGDLVASEGAVFELLFRALALPGWEGKISARVSEGRVLAADRRVLGTLSGGRLRFPSVPAGPCTFELRLDGQELGRDEGVVSSSDPLDVGLIRGAPR